MSDLTPLAVRCGSTMAGDTVTIIRSRHRRLAKLVRPGGLIKSYDAVRVVDLIERPVADLDHLGRLVGTLLSRPDCAVVRGAVIDADRSCGVRRLIYADKKTGTPPTLQEMQRRWLALDMDDLLLPAWVDWRDLAACGGIARGALPAAFHDVRFLVQATASHGIKPGARLRLWCWCDHPMSGPELKRWLRNAPVDRSIFGPGQPIFTAAPVFADGAIEHMPVRLIFLPGRPEVSAPSSEALAPPPPAPPAPPAPPPRRDDTRAQRYAFAALAGAAARVSQACEGNHHPTLIAQARSLQRLVAARLISSAEVEQVLGDAIELAGKERLEASAVIAWATDHPTGSSLPQFEAR